MPSNRRSRLLGPGLFLGLLLLLIVGGGITFTLWYMDVIEIPFLEEEQVQQPDEDLIMVPVSGRVIPAFGKVTRDDLWNPQAIGWATVPMRKSKLDADILTSRSDILGRVMANDKKPLFVFTENDFLPRGTRPGIVGGIPPGKVAMRIEASKVRGLHDLKVGDTFDLISTMPIEAHPDDLRNLEIAGGMGDQLKMQAKMTNSLKRATVDTIVLQGIIVQPVGIRAEPQQTASFTQGVSTKMKPVQEAVIAIWRHECDLLAEALAVESTVTAIPYSGNPSDPINPSMPQLGPLPTAEAVPAPASIGTMSGIPIEAQEAASRGLMSPNRASRDAMGDLLKLDFLPADMKVVESISGGSREVRAVPKSKSPK